MAKAIELDLSKDVTWWQAARYFWSFAYGLWWVNFLLVLCAALCPFDDGWDAIPGLDIISIGDDAFIPFVIFWSLKGISRMVKDANTPEFEYVG